MVLGGFLLTVEAGPGTKEEDAESLRLFNNLLVLVEENYATRIDSERAVYGAIDGMLRTLDPHSKFLDPKAFKSLREDQTGSYAGLGIQVQSLFGKVTIVSRPFPDSPAEKAGLRVGDMITHVDGRSTTGLAVEEVVSKLRGAAGHERPHHDLQAWRRKAFRTRHRSATAEEVHDQLFLHDPARQSGTSRSTVLPKRPGKNFRKP